MKKKQTPISKYYLYIRFTEIPLIRPINAVVKPGNILMFTFNKELSLEDRQKFIGICTKLNKFGNPVEVVKEEYD